MKKILSLKILSLILALMLCAVLLPAAAEAVFVGSGPPAAAELPDAEPFPATAAAAERDDPETSDGLALPEGVLDEGGPSYALAVPEAVTVAQNAVYTAVPVSVTELNMVTGPDGKTPVFLRLVFNGLTLKDVNDENKTISCQLRKDPSDSPSNQRLYNVYSPGSYGVEIVISAAAWEAVTPGIYEGSIEYETMWRYSNNSWSDDLETGTIPVRALVSEADPVVTFDLNGREYDTSGNPFTVFTIAGLEYCGETPAPQNPGPGGLAIEPPAPTVNSPFGFIRFGGWYTNKACTAPFDFNAPVVESRTLYAKWIKDEDYYSQKYNGLLCTLTMSEDLLDAYTVTGDSNFCFEGASITDFDLIEGLDYDPENKTLIFNGYDGYMVRINDYGSIYHQYTEDDSFAEIRVENDNSIQLPFVGLTAPNNTYAVNYVSFTGNGTINLNAKAEDIFDRERIPWPLAHFQWAELVSWDGPTLNVTGASLGINVNLAGHEPAKNMKMLSGEINIEITPGEIYGSGVVARANRLELLGGSLHVHYVKDLDAVTSRLWSTITADTIAVGAHPVLVGMDYETYISPDFDFQITVDQELTDLGFSAYPFDAEDFVFSYLDPEYINNYYEGIPDQADFIGDPIPDINQVPGLSYDYDHYTGLDDELPHTLVLENYSGPGLFARSLRYPFTRLDIEVRGENTIYCNGYAGLAFDDLDVHFTGDGVLRFVSVDTGERRSYNTGDEYIFLYALSQSGISWVYDSSNAVEECPPSVTVEGPTLIFDGYYHKGALYELKNVTVLSGSISMNARHCPINASEQNPIPAKYTATIDSVFRDYAYNDVYEGVFLLGGETVINFQPSPIHTDVFRLKNNGDPGLCLMWLKSEPICAADTLLLVGEERVLRFDDYLYEKDLNDGSGDFTHFTATNIRKIQTAEAEGGRALVRAEGGKAIVTFEPEPGMEPVSLSYVADNGDPVDIPRGPDGWAFEYPVAQVITITPVFGPMDGYFLIGPDWSVESIDWTREFAPNPNTAGEYLLRTELAEGEQIKAVHVTAGVIDAWYPEGMGNEYSVDAAHSGDVIVCFRPEYQADWAAFGGHIRIAAPPTEPVETDALRVFSSISVGTDMVVTWSARKSEVQNYGRFWIEVVKHGAEGDESYRFGAGQEAALTEGNTTWSCDFRHIFAKEMGVEIEARVYAEDASGQVWMSPAKSTNIRDYLAGRLTVTNNAVAQRVLAADMLNYGAAAQLYMGYETDHLVNRELTAAQMAKLRQYETRTSPPVEKTNSNYRPAGTANILFNSVSLDNEVILFLTVLGSEGNEVKVLMKDHESGTVLETLDTAWNGSKYTVEYSGIGADKMRVAYDFTAQIDGVETGNVRTWSVEGYVGEIRNGGNQLQIGVANALLAYGDSAAAYFAAQ